MSPSETMMCWLGRVAYGPALALQEALHARVLAGAWPDTLLLLEHPPVITLGRSSSPANVIAPSDRLEALEITVERVGRGGEVTYHGPGQLVGYAIRRVGRAVRKHVEGMASGLAAYLASLGVEATWDRQTPGLWVGEAKIAAVGVEVRGGVTLHGFALNLDPEMSHFELIVPCGLRRPVTSLRQLANEPPTPAAAASAVGQALGRAWSVGMQPVLSDVLWRVVDEQREHR